MIQPHVLRFVVFVAPLGLEMKHRCCTVIAVDDNMQSTYRVYDSQVGTIVDKEHRCILISILKRVQERGLATNLCIHIKYSFVKWSNAEAYTCLVVPFLQRRYSTLPVHVTDPILSRNSLKQNESHTSPAK